MTNITDLKFGDFFERIGNTATMRWRLVHETPDSDDDFLCVSSNGATGYFRQGDPIEPLPDCDSFEWQPPKPLVMDIGPIFAALQARGAVFYHHQVQMFEDFSGSILDEDSIEVFPFADLDDALDKIAERF